MEDKYKDMEDSASQKMNGVYSEITIDHALHPRNMGGTPNPDGYSRITGTCGDTMEIWLKVRNDVIIGVSFQTDGCAATVACGSIATELIKSKSIPRARVISQQEILVSLNGLPDGNAHCALLAANTIKAAVRNYMDMKKEPWKKAYRKE